MDTSSCHWLALRTLERSAQPGHAMLMTLPRVTDFLMRHASTRVVVLHDLMELHNYIYELDLPTARRRLVGFMWGNS